MGIIMTVPDFQTLMRPLLECAQNGHEVKTSDCIEIIAKRFNISEADREQLLPSGRQTVLTNRVHWARTFLGKAAVIGSTKRGHFKLNKRGFELL